MCFGREDIDTLKRPRIAAVLNNEGFSGEFPYGMFDLPDSRADRFGLPWPRCPDSGEDNSTSSKTSGSNHTAARATRPKITRVPNDESDGGEEAYAFHPKGGITLSL